MTLTTHLGLVLIPAFALAACAAPHAEEAPIPPAVRVAEARPPQVPRGLRYAAIVRPSDQVTLAVKASGYVTSLGMTRGVDGRTRPLQPGDTVRAGTVLVRVSDGD